MSLKCVAKIAPTKGTEHAAAFDVYAPKNGEFFGEKINRIDLELCVEIPSGYYGQLAARSSFAVGHGMHVLGGVIDSDYRGSINLIATSIRDFTYEKGDRIAQLIILPIAPFKCFENVSELSSTDRGTGGFGSTGV
jgi:dUTP pyrophosphatase